MDIFEPQQSKLNNASCTLNPINHANGFNCTLNASSSSLSLSSGLELKARNFKTRRKQNIDATDSVNIRDIILSPSYAGLLKHLAFIRNDCTASCDIFTRDMEVDKFCSFISASGVEQDQDSLSSVPPILSFPVVADFGDKQRKEDDIFISSLSFRTFARRLALDVIYRTQSWHFSIYQFLSYRANCDS